jgi:hypothetical protein
MPSAAAASLWSERNTDSRLRSLSAVHAGSQRPRRRSCGGGRIVACGPGDTRQSPAKLVERALLCPELRRGASALPELCPFERQRLDPPNEPDELTSFAVRLELVQVAAGSQRRFLLPKT